MANGASTGSALSASVAKRCVGLLAWLATSVKLPRFVRWGEALRSQRKIGIRCLSQNQPVGTPYPFVRFLHPGTRQVSVLSRLELWYSHQRNGTWERSRGVVIESCDKGGWLVKVILMGTKLEHVAFPEVAVNVDAAYFAQGPRWLHCRIEEGAWHGAGDETKLARILELFLDWAETHGV